MPRDLFGDVTRPSISIGSRKWYTLPVSLISHAAIVLALVALPLLAPALLPDPWRAGIDAAIITIIPPPPAIPPKARPTADLPPVENPYAAPLVAPDTIAPETPIDLDWQDTPGVITPGLVPGVADAVIVPPPEPAPPQHPVPVGGLVRTPSKIRDVQPAYPPMALQARVEGIVIIEATIGVDGQVINARVLRPAPLLDQAALDAVRQWQFTPTLLNGVPVPVVMTVTVTFTLR